MKRTLLSRGLCAACLCLAQPVFGATAPPPTPLVRAESVTSSTRATWQEQIARARREDPESFVRVERAASRVKELDATKRGMLAVVSPLLKDLGDSALWPMVEQLAFSTSTRKAAGSESAQLALTVGLVEATGELRDARLAPLWQGMLEGPDTRAPVLKAAAQALARVESVEAARTLIELSRGDTPAAVAAQEALGDCRRLVVARALATALDARPAAPEARRLIVSLGNVGSAWAWKTPSVKAREEEADVRRVAATALFGAYGVLEGDLRQAASNSLLLVDAPETEVLIEKARRGPDGERLRGLLDALSERLRRNPLR